MGYMMEKLPIARPSCEVRSLVEGAVSRLLNISSSHQRTRIDVLDWLRVEHEISEPTTRLQSIIGLDSDAFIAEVRKVRGKKKSLSLAALKSLREEHANTIIPAQTLATEARALEQQVSDLVNATYSLTSEDVRLMWETAPPRMPVIRPEH
ncbi:hypothetical protein ACYOEI_16945 [Singulisphaera rosea]